jgi:hypothetical protein
MKTLTEPEEACADGTGLTAGLPSGEAVPLLAAAEYARRIASAAPATVSGAPGPRRHQADVRSYQAQVVSDTLLALAPDLRSWVAWRWRARLTPYGDLSERAADAIDAIERELLGTPASDRDVSDTSKRL